MNDQLIENLLRNAPAPKAPVELREKLITGICLSGMETSQADLNPRPFWFKQWFPALSFAALLLTCVVVIGVQFNQVSQLRRENETLRVHNQNLPELREANAEVQRLRNENSDLDRLRKNDAELQRLRAEVARLRGQTEGLSQLRAENDRLQAAAKAGLGEQPDFFAQQKERADRIACVNNLKQLGVAQRVWANDNDGRRPKDFASMTNEIQFLKYLQCPGDKSHRVTSWAQVAAGDVSYRIYADGLSEKDNPNTVIFECPVHHNFGLLDGSVQQVNSAHYENRFKTIDGRLVFAP